MELNSNRYTPKYITITEAVKDKICPHCHQIMEIKQINLTEAVRQCFKCATPLQAIDITEVEFIHRSYKDIGKRPREWRNCISTQDEELEKLKKWISQMNIDVQSCEAISDDDSSFSETQSESVTRQDTIHQEDFDFDAFLSGTCVQEQNTFSGTDDNLIDELNEIMNRVSQGINSTSDLPFSLDDLFCADIKSTDAHVNEEGIDANIVLTNRELNTALLAPKMEVPLSECIKKSPDTEAAPLFPNCISEGCRPIREFQNGTPPIENFESVSASGNAPELVPSSSNVFTSDVKGGLQLGQDAGRMLEGNVSKIHCATQKSVKREVSLDEENQMSDHTEISCDIITVKSPPLFLRHNVQNTYSRQRVDRKKNSIKIIERSCSDDEYQLLGSDSDELEESNLPCLLQGTSGCINVLPRISDELPYHLRREKLSRYRVNCSADKLPLGNSKPNIVKGLNMSKPPLKSEVSTQKTTNLATTLSPLKQFKISLDNFVSKEILITVPASEDIPEETLKLLSAEELPILDSVPPKVKCSSSDVHHPEKQLTTDKILPTNVLNEMMSTKSSIKSSRMTPIRNRSLTSFSVPIADQDDELKCFVGAKFSVGGAKQFAPRQEQGDKLNMRRKLNLLNVIKEEVAEKQNDPPATV